MSFMVLCILELNGGSGGTLLKASITDADVLKLDVTRGAGLNTE